MSSTAETLIGLLSEHLMVGLPVEQMVKELNDLALSNGVKSKPHESGHDYKGRASFKYMDMKVRAKGVRYNKRDNKPGYIEFYALNNKGAVVSEHTSPSIHLFLDNLMELRELVEVIKEELVAPNAEVMGKEIMDLALVNGIVHKSFRENPDGPLTGYDHHYSGKAKFEYMGQTIIAIGKPYDHMKDRMSYIAFGLIFAV